MPRSSQLYTLKISAKWVPRPLLEIVRRSVEKAMGFQGFNEVYAGLPACTAAEFPQKFLDGMEVSVKVDGKPEETIPATGALIVVANHPFGFIEGIALDAMLLRRRPDVTMMSVYLFGTIPEIKERYIFVDPEKTRRKRKLNPRGWRQSFQWLARGGTLGVFPAGRLARFQWSRMRVADQPWSPHIAAIARRTNTPVLPVYFHGQTNWFFQILGALSPRLQHFLIFREVTDRRGETLRATIGALVAPDRLSGFASDEEATEFLRRETERLGG